ncbi:hypothetical protein KEM54_003157 [Ascosphaera aggregata]|nr:hypothetical protein KEM54_003157 [Ascosphaera aggregata]
MSRSEQSRMQKAPGYAAKPPPLVSDPDISPQKPRRPLVKQNVPPVVDITKTAKYRQAKNRCATQRLVDGTDCIHSNIIDRWTGIIVGAAASIYFSYALFQRLYIDKGQKKTFHPHQSRDAEPRPASTPNP